MARVRGTCRSAPPSRKVQYTPHRHARNHESTANGTKYPTDTDPFTNPRAMIEQWYAERPKVGDMNEIFFGERSWTFEEEEMLNHIHEARNARRKPDIATVAHMESRMSSKDLPPAKYEEYEGKRSREWVIMKNNESGHFGEQAVQRVSSNIESPLPQRIPVFPPAQLDLHGGSHTPILHLNFDPLDQYHVYLSLKDQKRGVWRRSTPDLYDATKSENQNLQYQLRAASTRNKMQKSLSKVYNVESQVEKAMEGLHRVAFPPIRQDDEEKEFETMAVRIPGEMKHHTASIIVFEDVETDDNEWWVTLYPLEESTD